jgi:hypothetical protein
MTNEQADAKLREYGLLFSALMESERFRELVGLYFTFVKAVNEETKEIELQVIENPPEIVAERMKGKVVEQENAIQVVTPGAAQAILDKAKKQAKRR